MLRADQRPEPVSRRDRPAKPPLSRGVIVATALDLIREDTDQRLTMRRLATALDTGAASLYVYFDTDEDLLRRVARGAFDELHRRTAAWLAVRRVAHISASSASRRGSVTSDG